MTKEALKLALEALEDLGMKHYEITGEVLYKDTFTAIKEALAQPEPWEKFCDSNCVWTDHHPDCKLAQLEQEPVAYGMWDTMLGKDNRMMMVRLDKGQDGCAVPLYTTPPQRKPLTNGEIYTAYITATNQTLRAQDERLALAFARAIEAAHGIKENT